MQCFGGREGRSAMGFGVSGSMNFKWGDKRAILAMWMLASNVF